MRFFICKIQGNTPPIQKQAVSLQLRLQVSIKDLCISVTQIRIVQIEEQVTFGEKKTVKMILTCEVLLKSGQNTMA